MHSLLINHMYVCSSKLAESYFVLWRLTHNPKYREYAWQLAVAIERHCKTESGEYCEVRNVNEIPTHKQDRQHPIFLSATLKYLYLTFTADTVLPLDQWTFNAVGHPLPVCGNNGAYPTEWC